MPGGASRKGTDGHKISERSAAAGLGYRAVVRFMREALWVYPLIAVAVGVMLAIYLTSASWNADQDLRDIGFSSTVSDARSLLGSLLGAMIAALAIVLSITALVYQNAASQFGPRTLRNYIRDRSTKLVISMFSGTIVYIISVLYLLGTEADAGRDEPRLSLTIALALVVASVATIAWYVNHTIQIIRIERLLYEIAKNTKREIRAITVRRADELAQARTLPAVPDSAAIVVARDSGYLQESDANALSDAAYSHGVVIWLAPMTGDHLTAGAPLAWTWPVDADASLDLDAVGDEVRESVEVRYSRTIELDVALGFRQLIDSAIKALSPAINDPYSALQSVDHLGDLLVQLARAECGTELRRDDAGRVRVVLPAPDFASYLELATGQIARYGAGEPAVMIRLLDMLAELAAVVDESNRADLGHTADKIDAFARQATATDADLHVIDEALERTRSAIARGYELPAPRSYVNL